MAGRFQPQTKDERELAEELRREGRDPSYVSGAIQVRRAKRLERRGAR